MQNLHFLHFLSAEFPFLSVEFQFFESAKFAFSEHKISERGILEGLSNHVMMSPHITCPHVLPEYSTVNII